MNAAMDRAQLALAVIGDRPALTFAQIARMRRLTKGQVAGIVYRHLNPAIRDGEPTKRGGPEHVFAMPILQLLADGRMRTSTEIRERVGCTKPTVCRNLRRFEAEGLVRCVSPSRATTPAIWVEVDDQ